MQFRKAEPEDLPAIEMLARKIWHEVYPGIISNEQIEYMLQKMYSRESLQISVEKHEFYLAFDDEKMIGYLETSTNDEKNYFMHKLYVDSFYHGKCVAQKLYDFVYSEKRNLNSIRLQVNRKNLRAINFYKKNGFEIEREKDFDIGDCFYMCDFVMVKRFTSE